MFIGILLVLFVPLCKGIFQLLLWPLWFCSWHYVVLFVVLAVVFVVLVLPAGGVSTPQTAQHREAL